MPAVFKPQKEPFGRQKSTKVIVIFRGNRIWTSSRGQTNSFARFFKSPTYFPHLSRSFGFLALPSSPEGGAATFRPDRSQHNNRSACVSECLQRGEVAAERAGAWPTFQCCEAQKFLLPGAPGDWEFCSAGWTSLQPLLISIKHGLGWQTVHIQKNFKNHTDAGVKIGVLRNSPSGFLLV